MCPVRCETFQMLESAFFQSFVIHFGFFPSTLNSLAFLSGLQDIYFPDILLFSLQFKLAENYFPAQMRKLYFAPFKLGSNSHQHWIHISHRETSYEESPNTSNDIHHFDLILICRLQLLVFKVCC